MELWVVDTLPSLCLKGRPRSTFEAAPRNLIGWQAMYVAGLLIALIAVWFAIGFGPVALLAGGRPLVERVLLAPAVGLAIASMPAFWINRMGFPVQSFATMLTAVLIIASIVTYAVVRPDQKCSWRSAEVRGSLVLVCVLFAGITVVDWPGLKDGIGWLGYANDDMGNFVLLAERVRHHGFFDPVSAQSVIRGSDFSELMTWSMRPASQIVLSLAGTLFGLSDPAMFMPLVVALYAAMAAAVTAIVYSEARSLVIATAVLVAIMLNPLNAFSAYSGLLGQAGGMAVGSAFLALSLTPWEYSTKRLTCISILLTIVLFSLNIWYFEFIPIAFGSVGLYLALNGRQTLDARKRLSLAIVSIILAVGVLSGTYGAEAFNGLLGQFFNHGATAHSTDVFTFPYFMVEAGLVSFWGLSLVSDVSLAQVPVWLFGLAAMLFVTALIALAIALYRGSMIGSVVAVIGMLGLVLLQRRADFGVFKACLYIQPFLAALVVNFIVQAFVHCRDRRFGRNLGGVLEGRVAAIGTLGVCLFVGAIFLRQTETLIRYGTIAAGDTNNALFNEVPGSARLIAQLASLPPLTPDRNYIVDSYNPVLTKLITYYTRGTPTRLISQNLFNIDSYVAYMTSVDSTKASDFARLIPVEVPFIWVSSRVTDIIKLQAQNREPPRPNDVLIATGSDNSILNRLELGNGHDILSFRNFGQVSNYVTFLPSRLSRNHSDYGFDTNNDEEVRDYRAHVALWPNEPDYFFPRQTFAGAGRYIMLNVLNPSDKPRLLIEMTSSFSPEMQFVLPPARAVTESAMPLATVGRGSARLYSEPITLVKADKLTVFGIDMGVDGRQSGWTEGKIADPRRLTTRVRDISLIPNSEYRSLRPPAWIDKFPADLADKALEYSGLYEDGWMAERAFLRLAGPPMPARFVLNGMAPWDPKKSSLSELVVRIDGVEKVRYVLQPGEFEVAFVIEPSLKPIRVDLVADGAIRLGPQDARPASILIRSIGWKLSSGGLPAEFRPSPTSRGPE